MLLASRLTLESIEKDHARREIEIIRNTYFTISDMLKTYKEEYKKYSIIPTNVRKHLDIFAHTAKDGYINISNNELNRVDSLFNI